MKLGPDVEKIEEEREKMRIELQAEVSRLKIYEDEIKLEGKIGPQRNRIEENRKWNDWKIQIIKFEKDGRH